MIVLEETTVAKRTQHVTDNSTFMASQENNNPVTPAAPHMRANRPNNNNSGGHGSRGSSSSNNRGGRNRGRGGRSHHQQHGTWNQPLQQPWAYPPWVTPQCPYPTAGNWQQPATLNRQPGILG
jgi:hypothetical protein